MNIAAATYTVQYSTARKLDNERTYRTRAGAERFLATCKAERPGHKARIINTMIAHPNGNL